MAEKSNPALDKVKKQAAYPLNAAIKDVLITSFLGPESLQGKVARSDPSNIQINTAISDWLPQTLMHEFEHVLQNNVANRYNKSYDRMVIEEVNRVKGSDTGKVDLILGLGNAATSTELRTHLKSLGASPSAYIGGLTKGEMSLREQWADLHAIEQQLGKDLTKDPVVAKEFFNNDKDVMKVYRASTGLRTQRLDSKDLPPMTVPSETVNSLIATPTDPGLIDQMLQFLGLGK